MEELDVAVIGSGPAGLAAAIKAKETGVENVTVFERSEELGGVLPQCIHDGFGLFYFKENLTGPEYASHFIEKTENLDVNIELESMVINLQNEEITVSSSQKGIKKYRAKAIVLAMGCRERTRGNLAIPGTRPAGIFTAGTAQRWINIEGYIPGEEAVILGSGDIGMIMARRFTLEGAKVRAVVEILPYPSGLLRNQVQCLEDFDIPLLLSHTVTNIHGRNRVEGVTISRVDENLQPIGGTEKFLRCDTLLLSVGLIPENELSRESGVVLDSVTAGPIVNSYMQTSVPCIFAAGNVVHVCDLVDDVTVQAEIAGFNAARFALDRLPKEKEKIGIKPGRNVRYVVPQYIVGPQEEATLYLRVKRPEKNVMLKVGEDVARRRVLLVRPPEMQKITLKKESLAKVGSRKELTVSCEPIT